MKMKILFLSPLPPPHYGSAMSSQMCLDILKESKKFEIRNIKLNYSKDMKDIGKINLSKIKGILYVKKQIKKQIKEFNPDIIYFVPATYSLGLIRDWIFVQEIKKYWKGKIIFHIRSRILKKTWDSNLGKNILKNMYDKNKAIILGRELEGDLKNIIPKKDISILPNAIKNEITESRLRKIIAKRSKNKTFNILFLSNMDRTKGWPKLLEACRILKQKNFNFQCDFIGAWLNEKDKEYFKNFIKQNKLEKQVFAHGKKTGRDKNKFLEKAKVLVFPTTYNMEACPRVILEAYMYGVPVIANSIATIPTTIQDNKTGFLLKKNTPQEIKKYLEYSMQNKTKTINIGLKGRKIFLKKYEIKKYEKDFINIISNQKTP